MRFILVLLAAISLAGCSIPDAKTSDDTNDEPAPELKPGYYEKEFKYRNNWFGTVPEDELPKLIVAGVKRVE